jgi:hypothetical protein
MHRNPTNSPIKIWQNDISALEKHKSVIHGNVIWFWKERLGGRSRSYLRFRRVITPSSSLEISRNPTLEHLLCQIKNTSQGSTLVEAGILYKQEISVIGCSSNDSPYISHLTLQPCHMSFANNLLNNYTRHQK